MDTISSNLTAQWGAIGFMIVGLIWFAKYMFIHFMSQQKQSQVDNNQSREDNKQLEVAFREYLILQAKEHHEIIKANTEAIAQMLIFFDKQLGEYMKSRIKSSDRLSSNIEQFIKEINSNL